MTTGPTGAGRRRPNKLHGLTRARIESEGLPAAQVLVELVHTIGGRRVLADSHLDDDWFRTLCRAAGTPPPFRIGHIRELTDVLATTPEEIGVATAVADRLAGRGGTARGRRASPVQLESGDRAPARPAAFRRLISGGMHRRRARLDKSCRGINRSGSDAVHAAGLNDTSSSVVRSVMMSDALYSSPTTFTACFTSGA